uniref:Uncharacterized protein n=1 Tax=Apteryx owenii TaxID=8824 RepID=A0A8B9QK78_APTOW
FQPGANTDGRFGARCQVIVMSSHETIRVLEVGVDAPLPAEEDRKALEMPAREVARGSPGETADPAREDVPPSAETSGSGDTAGKTPSSPGSFLGLPRSERCSETGGELHPRRPFSAGRRLSPRSGASLPCLAELRI